MTGTFDPLDHVTPREDLEALHHLARACAARQTAGETRPTVALEVGTWAGSSALVLESAFDLVFCVDTWQGTPSDRLGALALRLGHNHIFRTFCRNMGEKLHRSVFPCVGSSFKWAAVWKRPLDLVFIDGDHDEDACLLDINVWRHHVAPGGVLCGHDYGVSFPGVTEAVHTLVPAFSLAGQSLWYKEFPN